MSQEIKICSADSGCFLGGLSATDTIASNSKIEGACIVKTGGTSSQFLKADGSADSTSYTDCAGTVTSVTAGTGMTQTGTSTVNPTLNVNSGDGITAGQTAVSVDSTVVRTSGAQTVGGEKNFTSNIILDNNIELRQKDSGGTERTVFELDSSNDLNVGGSYAGALRFIGGGSYTEQMRVHDDGNVGIGTAAPTQKLVLSGDTGTNVLIQQNDGGGIFLGSSGGTRFGLGTGANIIQATSTDFGIGTQGGNSFTIGTDNNNRLHIKSTGEVGIGTDDPDQKLTVEGSSAAIKVSESGGAELRLAAGGSLGYVGTYNSNDLAILAAGGEKIRVATSGNVGIGTTGPNALLNVQGDSDPTILINAETGNSANSGKLAFAETDGGAQQAWMKYDGSANRLEIGTSDVSQALVVDRVDGDVGIGASSPDSKLHVCSARTTERAIVESTNSNAYVGFRAKNGSGHWEMQVDGSNQELRWLDDDSERMRIDSSGNVGIGATNPSDKLEVYGNGADVAIRIHEDAGTHEARLHLRRGGSDWEIINNDDLAFETEGSEIARFKTNGNVGIGVTNPSHTLHLSSAASVPIAYERGGTDAKKWGFHIDSYNTYWQNITDSCLALTISNAGNVGIGTTSPSEKLTVNGSISANGAILSGGVNIAEMFGSSGGGVDAGTAGKLTKYNSGGDNIEDSIVTESSSLITVAGAIDVDNICANDTSNNLKYGCDVGAGGISNIGIGKCASNAMTTGFNNIAIGTETMKNANGICRNVTIGDCAGRALAAGGDDNVAIGTGAMLNATTGTDNVAIGKNAISCVSTGCENVAIGLCAAYSQTTGTNNIAIGDCSNSGSTTGSYNVSIGSQAGFYALSGDHNVAMGQYALYDNWGGDYNTALGTAAMQCTTTGSNNAALGYRALMNNTTGNDNFAVGECALQSNVNGIGNTALGQNAFGSNVTGNYSVAIGACAGAFQTNGCTTLSAASDSIYIGRNTKGKNNNDCNSIVIGYDACSCGQNTIKLGNNAITAACIHVAWTVISDERDKTDIADLNYGLDFINDLQPKAFKYRNTRTSTATDGRCRYGFVAQDIQDVEDGDKVIVNEDNPEQYGINTDYIVPILVNAVKDLKARVEALETP